MVEEWRPVAVTDWSALYSASSLGSIRRDETGRILTPSKHPKGYQVVTLSGNGQRKQFLVHRLVLWTFEGPCPDGQESRHKNGNRADNCWTNLEWGTSSENELDKRRHGTTSQGAGNGAARITEEIAREIISRHENGDESQRALAAVFGLSQPQVCRILTGRRWGHLTGR